MSFLEKTLFVVGAGAGVDHRMPLGSDLQKRIARGGDFRFDFSKIVRGDAQLFDALQYKVPRDQLDSLIRGMQRIAASIMSADSIDTCIDRFRGDSVIEQAGKLLIAYYILTADKASAFVVNPDMRGELPFAKHQDDWLTLFSSMLFSGVSRSELDSLPSRVAIVCFNYDRCIERFLMEAIRQGYEVDATKAHALVREMMIIRPYGHLGELPPSASGFGGKYVRYGAEPSDVDLMNIANGLKTFTEAVDDGLKIQLSNMVSDAKRVVFLGFAFHSPNVRLLTIPYKDGRREVYASGVGLSAQERDALIDICDAMVGHGVGARRAKPIHIEVSTDCRALLGVHRLNLLER